MIHRLRNTTNAYMQTQPAAACLLVGFRQQFAVTGLSLAFELLLAGLQRRHIPYRLVDLGELWDANGVGRFTSARAWIALRLLWLFYRQLIGAPNVYMTIASSRVGFLRDALMIWPARLGRRRLVLHLHGAGYQAFYQAQPHWLQRLIARTLAQADTIIVLGESLREHFAFVPGYRQKVQVVPNGLPLGVQCEAAQTKSLPSDGPLRLLFLSNMLESKGYLKVLAACRILHQERNLPLHCDFGGDFIQTVSDQAGTVAAAQQAFLQLIQRWGVEEVVTYHGLVTGAAKQHLLEQAHLLLLPTTYPWEGQPLSIIEALATSTPVIATRQGAIPEQVHDGYNGFLRQAEPTVIADAIEHLWRNPTLYGELSRNARSHFLAHYTSEKHLERLIPLIVGTDNQRAM
jgi:glycosyltransferase involved in cell wall biosynthesis